jgi:hypothetical protein
MRLLGGRPNRRSVGGNVCSAGAASTRTGAVWLSNHVKVAFIPSVSGGFGHITRAAKLLRGLELADPSLTFCFVLSELGLRAATREAVERLGYPVRILPNPVRHERDRKIRKVLGDIDVVIEDTERRLIAYRRVVPHVRTWISVPMLPIWDELFMDWPYLEHADHVLYTYPRVMPVPKELASVGDRLTVTGPILDPDEMPSREAARDALTWGADERVITYAPRDFPFGRWFGLRVLNGLVGGFVRARKRFPELRLVLTAVPKPAAIQPPALPPLATIPGVTLKGIVSTAEARDHIAGADLVVVEGTSTLFDAAVARTPVFMVPGLIYETSLEGTWVNENGAGIVMRPDDVTRVSVQRVIERVFDEPAKTRARVEKLRKLVGESGRDIAVAAILRTIAATQA